MTENQMKNCAHAYILGCHMKLQNELSGSAGDFHRLNENQGEIDRLKQVLVDADCYHDEVGDSPTVMMKYPYLIAMSSGFQYQWGYFPSMEKIQETIASQLERLFPHESANDE